MNKKILFTCLGLSLLLAGCGKVPTLKDGKEIVTKVTGKDFSTEELYQELKEGYGYTTMIAMVDKFITEKEITDDKAANSHADSQIKQMKEYYEKQGYDFEQMVTSNGFANEAAFREYIIKEYKKEQVAKNYYKEQLTDKEIKAYYNSEIFGEMTVKHILIKPDVASDATDDEKEKANEKALNEAKELIKKIEKGSNFEELAKKYSDDTGTATEGGLFSNFSKQDVDAEFWSASAKLKDGKYTTTPVKSQFGYHVILRVSQKAKPSLDEVKDTITNTLVSDKMKEDNAIEKAWVEVRKEYKLDIIDSDIKTSYDKFVKNLEKNGVN